MKGKLNLHIQIVVHSRCSALSANLHYGDTRVKRRNEEATGDISGQGFQELRGTKLMQSVGPHSLSADSLAPRMELRPIRASQHILKGSLRLGLVPSALNTLPQALLLFSWRRGDN